MVDLKLLVVGSGAREHALVWKLSRSSHVERIYCAPGNPGIAEIAKTVDIEATDIDGLLNFAKAREIDLVVVGPEQPLVMGISDRFKSEGIKLFGPDKRCSRLEGSKTFSKAFMKKYGVPTARYEEYNNLEEAIFGLRNFDLPVVIKADGLAAGKGVVVAESRQKAAEAIRDMMESGRFGYAGKSVVVEEFLDGVETSLLCFVDGSTIVTMESARDYKKAFDGDTGPNTGGMGACSPNSAYEGDVAKSVEEKVIKPIVEGLSAENMDYRGVLFIGLMICKGGPKVLEFNVRFGDPETQALMPRLGTDLVEIMDAVVEGKLKEIDLEWSEKCTACIVLSSDGYPELYETGKEITGLKGVEDALVFQGGTKLEDGKLLTDGGRVLSVVSCGDTIEDARRSAYKGAMKIKFEGKRHRGDIGL